jgi:hypothetical protein
MIDPSSSEEEDDDRGHKSKHGHKTASKGSGVPGGAVSHSTSNNTSGGPATHSTSSHHSTPDKVNQSANNLRQQHDGGPGLNNNSGSESTNVGVSGNAMRLVKFVKFKTNYTYVIFFTFYLQ